MPAPAASRRSISLAGSSGPPMTTEFQPKASTAEPAPVRLCGWAGGGRGAGDAAGSKWPAGTERLEGNGRQAQSGWEVMACKHLSLPRHSSSCGPPPRNYD